MKKKTIIQVIISLVLLCSLIFIAAGIANEMKLRKLRSSSVVVEGSVLDGGRLDNPRGIKTHYLKVEFQKENKEKVTKDFPVDNDDYLHARQLGKIPITYVPNKLGLSLVGGYYGYNRIPLYVAIVGFLFSSVALLITRYLYNKTKNANQYDGDYNHN
jgi:hypothetical protein